MANPSNQQFSFITVTKDDLNGSGSPTRLNQALRLIGEQVSKTQGGQGPFTFGVGPFTFRGQVNMNGGVVVVLPQFPDNVSAKKGGLVAGQLYQLSGNFTGSSPGVVGQVMVVY